MNSRRAVIFLNGNKSDFKHIHRYIDENTVLIGCDGGTQHLVAIGYKPHVIIGDLDSFQPPANENTRVISYPSDKDQTDSELAINEAVRMECDPIIVAGLLGDRVDHVLANILLLNKYFENSLVILEGNQEIYLLRDKTIINGARGDIISFIPVNGLVRIKRSQGLKYDLTKYQLSSQDNLGISNQLTAGTAEVIIDQGSLLVVHQKAYN